MPGPRELCPFNNLNLKGGKNHSLGAGLASPSLADEKAWLMMHIKQVGKNLV